MNLSKQSIKFAVGDRVRVNEQFNGTGLIHTGLTGTITKVAVECRRSASDRTPGFIVRFDKPLAITNIKPQVEHILMYADELEYEDNRDDAIFGEVIAWNLDYVWFGEDEVTPEPAYCELEDEPTNYRLFANLRKGDTAVIVQCVACSEVLGSNFPYPVETVKNVSYLCRYPLTFEDSTRDPFYND